MHVHANTKKQQTLAREGEQAVFLCVSDTPACGSWTVEGKCSSAHSAERPLATMPSQSLQHFGTPAARCISLSLSASRLSPNPRLFLSASIFLSSQRVCPYKTFLVRAGEALPSTVGTPGKMVNRHTSFCRQAPQLYRGPGDTSESDFPFILILYRDDQ